MITYTDDYFSNVDKVVEGYLQSPKNQLFRDLARSPPGGLRRLSYIRQARKVRALEESLLPPASRHQNLLPADDG